MSTNPTLDSIFKRRSIRKYTNAPVSADHIRTILEAGRWAPSGKNSQPWRFQVLFDGDPRKNTVAALSRHARMLEGSAALIIVALDKSACYHEVKDHQGAGACLQNMLLAAHSLGLGAVWIGELVAHGSKALHAIGQSPETFEFMAAIAVGHPENANHVVPPRRPLEELMLEQL